MKSNGYGSFIKNIVISVDKKVAAIAQEELDAELLSETEDRVEMLFVTQGRGRGDDETIIYEIASRLGPDVDWEHIKIIWEKSEY